MKEKNKIVFSCSKPLKYLLFFLYLFLVLFIAWKSIFSLWKHKILLSLPIILRSIFSTPWCFVKISMWEKTGENSKINFVIFLPKWS